VGQLGEIRARAETAVCSNEGLWSEAEAYSRIRARDADVYCLSPYWVGSIGGFQRLSWLAHYEGLQICKHTHGELGLAAAASHHVVLTLPNGVEGHQQTAYLMEHDILTEPIPISTGPRWGTIDDPGLGVDVDEDAVAEAAARYHTEGQYLPWQDFQIAREER
jgi:L-alanine-DL-glutamate epimerase-like enolase superfamily enzyme